MKHPNKRRRNLWKRLLIVLGILLLVGGITAHFAGKRLGYSGAWDFITSFGSHTSRGMSADYETIDIKIDEADYKKLKTIRDEAVKVGMQLPVSDPWVKGKITYKGKEIKIKLRLKGHMTDHLEGKKWSFRIKTRKGNSFKGMRIFSIQHPGTRGYAYEWIFHEVMRREGLITLKYDFINVNLNGENLGIYALEENFGEELIEHNKRPAGPIVRFNPDMYWVFRHDELLGKGKTFLHESASWKSSYLEPMDDDNVYKDSSLLRSYSEALLLMNAFRKGKIATSQAFDYKALAVYHAWIDIIGGTHSLDWTDVKYYYNPVTKLFEPIVYESFSAFPVYSLCGQFRFTGDTVKRDNFHDLLFSDTTFYAEYIRQLTRMSDKKWINKTLNSIDKDLQSKLDILYSEWPYRDFTTGIYSQNASAIQKMLQMPSYVNTYTEKITNDSLCFTAANIDGFPVRVKYVEVDGIKYNVNSQNIVIPAKAQHQAPMWNIYLVALPDSVLHNKQSNVSIKLYYSVLGSSHTASSIMLNTLSDLHTDLPEYTDIRTLSFAETDEQNNIVYIKPGSHKIEGYVRVPTEYKLKVGPGTKLDLLENGWLVVDGNVDFEGTEEFPIEFTSSTGNGEGVSVRGNRTNKLTHVQFSRMKRTALSIFGGRSVLNNVRAFNNASSGMAVWKGSATLNGVYVTHSGGSGLECGTATVVLRNSHVFNSGDDGIRLNGTNFTITNSEILNNKKSGVDASIYSEVMGSGNKISGSKNGIHATNGAHVVLRDVRINDCAVGVKTSHKKDTYGYASVTLSRCVFTNVKKESAKADGTTIQMQK